MLASDVLPFTDGGGRPLSEEERETLERACRDLEACGQSWAVRAPERAPDRARAVCDSMCRNRLCSTCANAKAARFAWLRHAVEAVNEEEGPAGRRPVFITLTWRRDASESLADARRAFDQALRRLSRDKEWRQHVDSGIRKIEATYSRGKGWHVHAHFIVAATYIDQKHGRVLSRMWSKATDGRGENVDIRKADDDAIEELLKYAVKSADLDGDAAAQYLCTMHGKRDLTTFGDWYGLPRLDGLISHADACIRARLSRSGGSGGVFQHAAEALQSAREERELVARFAVLRAAELERAEAMAERALLLIGQAEAPPVRGVESVRGALRLVAAELNERGELWSDESAAKSYRESRSALKALEEAVEERQAARKGAQRFVLRCLDLLGGDDDERLGSPIRTEVLEVAEQLAQKGDEWCRLALVAVDEQLSAPGFVIEEAPESQSPAPACRGSG